MEVKKTTKADLNKRTVLFLQIGLILVLLIAYFIIQWRSYDKAEIVQDVYSHKSMDEVEIPVTILQTPPPPKMVIPDVIEPAPDDPNIKEDLIPSTEVDPNEIVEVDHIVEIIKDKPIETVPFIEIEDVPIFPGCEVFLENEERKKCMSEKITKFINKEFNSDLGNKLGLKGINRINVMFKIDETGNITDVQTRAAHPQLEIEARRVIEALPKMKPGKQRGNPVIVQYSLPIIFQVQE
ncbi:energy transducer TonB [Gillisia marina]|uniref:energy transducer TonB n=1 Tax=Gillisia marina TaxID=1167637 RepID=UPI000299D0DC|nr:energy transducer TonB [Gillisia marina]